MICAAAKLSSTVQGEVNIKMFYHFFIVPPDLYQCHNCQGTKDPLDEYVAGHLFSQIRYVFMRVIHLCKALDGIKLKNRDHKEMII